MLIVNDPSTPAWVANQTEADPRLACASVGWIKDGEHTCGIFYDSFTGASITATFAVAPGAVFPKEFLQAIFTYPFDTLKCGKMIALVASDNAKCISMVERMGFKVCAEVPKYYPDSDLLIYTLTRSQCRYLENEHEQENQNA